MKTNTNAIRIHKEAGKLRPNCMLIEEISMVPTFLVEDGAVDLVDDYTAVMHAVEGPAKRSVPFFLCWEPVSAENKDKVPGNFGCWPKDNGFETIKIVNGRCYDKAPVMPAVLLGDELPDFVQEAGFPVIRKGDTWELVRTDWGGDVRSGKVGKAFWVSYGPGDVNILSLDEASASEYFVQDDFGTDIGRLTDIIWEMF